MIDVTIEILVMYIAGVVTGAVCTCMLKSVLKIIKDQDK